MGLLAASATASHETGCVGGILWIAVVSGCLILRRLQKHVRLE